MSDDPVIDVHGLTKSFGERVVVDANFLVDSESRLKSALTRINGEMNGARQ